MDNLDVGETSSKSEQDDDEETYDKTNDKMNGNSDLSSLNFDKESIILHPIYILG